MANQKRPRRYAAGVPGLVKRWLVALGLLLAVSPIALLLAADFVLQFPASMLASPIESISHGDVRLVRPAGQIHSGRAELWVRDATRREWMPWMPVEWNMTSAWSEAGPALVLVSNLGTARLDRAGVALSDVQTRLPPSLLLARVNHPLAKAPWRGDIELVSSRLVCGWAGLGREFPSCEGQAVMHWRGMASAILPLQEIGSYAASISARSQNNGNWHADISTEFGAVAVSGVVDFEGGVVSFRIRITGENNLIGGLDRIAGPGFKRQENIGELLLERKM